MTSRSNTTTPRKNIKVDIVALARTPRRPDMYPRMYSTLTTTSVRRSKSHHPRDKNVAPASIEVEHRSALVAANQAIQDVKNFRAAYRLDGIDVARCKRTVAELSRQLGETTRDQTNSDDDDDDDRQVTPLVNVATFCNLLASGKIEQQQRRRCELDQLALICVHQKAFDDLITVSWDRLRDVAQNHVARYCVSFAQELTGREDVRCVQNYEAEVRQIDDAVAAKTSQLNELLSSYSTLKQLDAEAYIDSRPRIAAAVDGTCGMIVDVGELVCRWVHADKAYPGKLWDTIINENVERGKLREDVKRLTRKRDALAHNVTRRQLVWDKTNTRLDEKKGEKRRTRVSRETVEHRTEKLRNELEEKQSALETNETKIQHRKSNSPRYLDMLWQRSEDLHAEIEKTKQNFHFQTKHLSRLMKEEQVYANEGRLLEEDLEHLDLAIREMRHRLKEIDADIEETKTRVKAKEATIAAAKKIRELKLSSMTLRNIYFHKMDNSKRDNLTRACRLVARRVGQAWSDLYLELPFIPERDRDKRHRDLEVLDMAAVHGDRPLREQAWHGLLKWRLFSHRGNVSQLVYSLKRIERRDLAYRVQQLYLKGTG